MLVQSHSHSTVGNTSGQLSQHFKNQLNLYSTVSLIELVEELLSKVKQTLNAFKKGYLRVINLNVVKLL